MKDRLSCLLKKENGRYVLESFALGKLSFKDIQNFAALSGIAELYPKLDQGFIVDLLSHRVNKVLMVKNEGFQIDLKTRLEDILKDFLIIYIINLFVQNIKFITGCEGEI